MAISTNPLLKGLSGKLGTIVVKQYKEQTVVTKTPDMSHRKLSEKQEESNMLMKMATRAAQNIIADPKQKQRACEMLKVEPGQVFRAIIKQYMLTDGHVSIFETTPQEQLDQQTLNTLKTIITTAIPDAEIRLFGGRGRRVYNKQSDWDILILTTNEYPNTVKWELQEKLLNVTIQQGTRVNVLLIPKVKWKTEQEYEALRFRIGAELLPV
jgi:predicted nucleotidyltransferase